MKVCVYCGYSGKHAQVGHVKHSYCCPDCNGDWYSKPPMSGAEMHAAGIVPEFEVSVPRYAARLASQPGLIRGLVRTLLRHRPAPSLQPAVVRTA